MSASNPKTKKTAPTTPLATATATGETPAAAPSTAPVASTAAAAPPASVAAVAQAAITSLREITASLTFYDPSAKDLKAARVANRVPVAALGVSATILETNPDRYPDFDPAAVRGSADYVGAMSPVVQQIGELQQRLSRSIFNRHGQGAADTLALYQTLKGLSRTSKGKDALAQQKALAKAMVRTSKKRRATAVTDKDLRGAEKGIRLTKVSAARGKAASVASAEAQAAAATQAAAAAGANAIASASQSTGAAPGGAAPATASGTTAAAGTTPTPPVSPTAN